MVNVGKYTSPMDPMGKAYRDSLQKCNNPGGDCYWVRLDDSGVACFIICSDELPFCGMDMLHSDWKRKKVTGILGGYLIKLKGYLIKLKVFFGQDVFSAPF